MYQEYDNAVEKVLEYLKRNQYTSSIVYTHQRCLRLMKDYFREINAPYSQEQAVEWLVCITRARCTSTF